MMAQSPGRRGNIGGNRPPRYHWVDRGQDTVIAAKAGLTAQIRAVTKHKGRVWLGYGSINETKRPLFPRYFNPDNGSFNSELSGGAGGGSVDAYYTHQIYQDKMYQFFTDPSGAHDDYYVWDGASGSYYTSDPPVVGHIYASCIHTDGNLYVAGERADASSRCTVWKFDGTTWSVVYNDTTVNRDWFCFIFSFNGYLWVQPFKATATTSLQSNCVKSLDGTTWTDAGFSLLPATTSSGYGTIVLPGCVLIHNTTSEATTLGTWYLFKGNAQAIPLNFDGFNCGPIATDGKWAYMFWRSRRLWATRDGEQWIECASALPVTTTMISFGWDQDRKRLLVGTLDSHLWEGIPY